MYLNQRLEEQMIQFKRYLLKRITVALIKWQTRTYIYGKVKVQENLFYLILSQQTWFKSIDVYYIVSKHDYLYLSF
jgi:hypothetical protein